jgi:hypothetical protein
MMNRRLTRVATLAVATPVLAATIEHGTLVR